MSKATDLIKQRQVSRELFMKYIYQRAMLKSGWEDIDTDLPAFIDQMEEDILEIHKHYGGRELDQLESYKEFTFDGAYLMDMCKAFSLNNEEVDSLINEYARNWTVDTMPSVDVSILRMATTEIKYMLEIPDSVSCNEAINLAKRYCEDGAYKYINGILGSIIENKK